MAKKFKEKFVNFFYYLFELLGVVGSIATLYVGLSFVAIINQKYTFSINLALIVVGFIIVKQGLEWLMPYVKKYEDLFKKNEKEKQMQT